MLYDLFDKEGNPITMEEFTRLFGDMDYRRIGLTKVGKYNVSTVWLGINHRHFGEGPPLIFETMIFSESGGAHEFEEYQDRYSTEAEALQGHNYVVNLIRTVEALEKETDARDP